MRATSLILAALLASFSACVPHAGRVEGSARAWQPLTIDFEGPATSETAEPNPFRDLALTVLFEHETSGDRIRIPGYFAADGQAAETSADSGSVWRVHFVPPTAGRWSYSATLREGPDVAIDGAAAPSRERTLAAGSVDVLPPDSAAPGHYAKGMLRYVGERYLRFDDGEWFIKGGADSPENLLAFEDFDGTRSLLAEGQAREGEAPTARLHRFEPHRRDWRDGNPTWQGRGHALIGALNYLANKGLNAFSFLTMNVEGDGQDVWPWISPEIRDRYDVSKLAQWEMVFSHADRLALFLHFKTQETENDLLLDGGELGPERRLYYRELVARFAHHNALNWNLGEENDIWEELDDPGQQRLKAYIDYILGLDPYDHPIVVHTYPGQQEAVYRPLLGDASELAGVSIQTAFDNVYDETLRWIMASREAGRPWVVANDEQGHYTTGVKPDGPTSNRDEIRRHTLWGNLMAGGAGVEYYFGYMYPPHTDLGAEDWRSRDSAWTDAARAIRFFREEVPFSNLLPRHDLATDVGARVLAAEGCPCVVQLPYGGRVSLTVGEGAYEVYWFDPANDGPLRKGAGAAATGPGRIDLGTPPYQPERDWVALVQPLRPDR